MIIVIWILLAYIVSVVAKKKGRREGLWAIYGFFLGPIALIHILVLDKTPAKEEQDRAASGRAPCPHCLEQIIVGARVCPYCRYPVEWAYGREPLPARLSGPADDRAEFSSLGRRAGSSARDRPSSAAF